MTRFKFSIAIAFLASVSSTPLLAQPVVRDPGAIVQTYASAEQGAAPVGSRVWPAPIGHRQPRATDIVGIAGNIDRSDDAIIDRRINICRGC